MGRLATVLSARLVSAVGSAITASAVPLYLVSSGRERWIPYSVLGFALGRMLGMRGLLPVIQKVPTRRILLATTLGGALALLLASLVGPVLEGAIAWGYFAMISAAAALLSTIDDSVAHAAIGGDGAGQRWVHLDSTLFTLARVLGPGLAMGLLLASGGKLSVLLLVDALSYLAASIFYWIGLKDDRGTARDGESPADRAADGSAYRWSELYLSAPVTWTALGFVALGASAYNAGAVVHLKQIQISVESTALFMFVQNVAMVMTGSLLVKWGALASRRVTAVVLAALGLFGVASMRALPALLVATSVMALGMVTFLQGLRAELATGRDPEGLRRMKLGFFSLINSMGGLLGVLVFSMLARQTTWKPLLLSGAGLMGVAIVVLSWGGLESRFRRYHSPHPSVPR